MLTKLKANKEAKMSESTVKEAEVGSWDTDFPADDNSQNNDRKKIEWMGFPKPGSYTVRLVGKYVKFLRHWKPFTDRVITHPDYKDEDPAWQAGFYPRRTFAVHVIDRTDGKLKILEKGSSIFKYFSRFKTINDIDPGGKEAPNFTITVEWPGGNKSAAKYTVMASQKAAPLTEEEREMVKENKAALTKIYATTPLQKIKDLWEAIPDKNKVAPKKTNEGNEGNTEKESDAHSKPLEETLPPATGDDDDLFGDNDKDGNDW